MIFRFQEDNTLTLVKGGIKDLEKDLWEEK